MIKLPIVLVKFNPVRIMVKERHTKQLAYINVWQAYGHISSPTPRSGTNYKVCASSWKRYNAISKARMLLSSTFLFYTTQKVLDNQQCVFRRAKTFSRSGTNFKFAPLRGVGDDMEGDIEKIDDVSYPEWSSITCILVRMLSISRQKMRFIFYGLFCLPHNMEHELYKYRPKSMF